MYGAGPIYLKRAFGVQGEVFNIFLGRGPRTSRASTLSPDLGSSSLRAFFSDIKTRKYTAVQLLIFFTAKTIPH